MGETKTDNTTTIPDHLYHIRYAHVLGRENKIPLILSIFIIDKKNPFTGL